MNQWTFVIAAYAIVAFATVGLVLFSYFDMRSAEGAAEAAKRHP